MEMHGVILKGCNSMCFFCQEQRICDKINPLMYLHILPLSLPRFVLSPSPSFSLSSPNPTFHCCHSSSPCISSDVHLPLLHWLLFFNILFHFLTLLFSFPSFVPRTLLLLFSFHLSFLPFSLSFPFGSHDSHPIFGIYFSLDCDHIWHVLFCPSVSG